MGAEERRGRRRGGGLGLVGVGEILGCLVWERVAGSRLWDGIGGVCTGGEDGVGAGV